jgi:hypothetical protein
MRLVSNFSTQHALPCVQESNFRTAFSDPSPGEGQHSFRFTFHGRTAILELRGPLCKASSVSIRPPTAELGTREKRTRSPRPKADAQTTPERRRPTYKKRGKSSRRRAQPLSVPLLDRPVVVCTRPVNTRLKRRSANSITVRTAGSRKVKSGVPYSSMSSPGTMINATIISGSL